MERNPSVLNQAEASTTNSTPVTTPAGSTPAIIDTYFELGWKGLTDEGRAQLSTQADRLKLHEDYGILIQGYTDQQGSASYNKQLGLKRAKTVKTKFLNAGVAEHQMKVVILGKGGVLCSDNSDVRRQMNRRVHLEIRRSARNPWSRLLWLQPPPIHLKQTSMYRPTLKNSVPQSKDFSP